MISQTSSAHLRRLFDFQFFLSSEGNLLQREHVGVNSTRNQYTVPSNCGISFDSSSWTFSSLSYSRCYKQNLTGRSFPRPENKLPVSQKRSFNITKLLNFVNAKALISTGARFGVSSFEGSQNLTNDFRKPSHSFCLCAIQPVASNEPYVRCFAISKLRKAGPLFWGWCSKVLSLKEKFQQKLLENWNSEPGSRLQISEALKWF